MAKEKICSVYSVSQKGWTSWSRACRAACCHWRYVAGLLCLFCYTPIEVIGTLLRRSDAGKQTLLKHHKEMHHAKGE